MRNLNDCLFSGVHELSRGCLVTMSNSPIFQVFSSVTYKLLPLSDCVCVVLGIKLRASHILRQMQSHTATPASLLPNFFLIFF